VQEGARRGLRGRLRLLLRRPFRYW
nr:immunoglobulin heavy chain junction region [Macaca mulatta]